MHQLTLALEYFHPWPNSAGFYFARSRGWYADAGIDLEIRCVDPGVGDTLEHLLRGRADYGIFPTNRLLVRRELGQPIVGLVAINQRGLETVRTRADSGIERPRDLVGRRVALNPTPRGLAIVRSLVEADGGDPGGVIIVDAGARELDPATHFDGIADATFGSYWAWDNLLTTLPASEERVWRVDDTLGLRYHSYLLGAREGRSDPGLQRAFLEVTEHGFHAAADEQAAASTVFEGVVPYFPPHVVARSLSAIAPTWFHEGEWGLVREELMVSYSSWLASHGILNDPTAWRAAVADVALVS